MERVHIPQNVSHPQVAVQFVEKVLSKLFWEKGQNHSIGQNSLIKSPPKSRFLSRSATASKEWVVELLKQHEQA